MFDPMQMQMGFVPMQTFDVPIAGVPMQQTVQMQAPSFAQMQTPVAQTANGNTSGTDPSGTGSWQNTTLHVLASVNKTGKGWELDTLPELVSEEAVKEYFTNYFGTKDGWFIDSGPDAIKVYERPWAKWASLKLWHDTQERRDLFIGARERHHINGIEVKCVRGNQKEVFSRKMKAWWEMRPPGSQDGFANQTAAPDLKAVLESINIAGDPLQGQGIDGTTVGSFQGPCKSFSGTTGMGFVEFAGQDISMTMEHVLDGKTAKVGDILNFDMEADDTIPGGFKAINITGGTGWVRDGAKGIGKDMVKPKPSKEKVWYGPKGGKSSGKGDWGKGDGGTGDWGKGDWGTGDWGGGSGGSGKGDWAGGSGGSGGSGGWGKGAWDDPWGSGNSGKGWNGPYGGKGWEGKGGWDQGW